MAKKNNIKGKHTREVITEATVRPAVYTDVVKAADMFEHNKRSHGRLKSVLMFLCAFLVGFAVIALASGFAYIQAKHIDMTTTTPVEVAQDMYHAIQAKMSGQDYTSQFDATPTPPSKPESDHQILPAEDKATSILESSNSSSSPEDTPVNPNLPAPVIAEYEGLLLHSPVRASDVTAIMFHQASYDYALVLDTKLPDIDAENIMNGSRKIDISQDQPTGDEYMNIPAMHVWRQEVTAFDTSIDVGSAPDTEALSPVSGTVVLVREYDLYDTIKDFEIHIQPDGRNDLDVVAIHMKDVSVKAGDKVVGGVTPIAKVRDIVGEGIIDIQLGVFIDAYSGNHCHIQVNNANSEGYRDNRLKGAYKVKE